MNNTPFLKDESFKKSLEARRETSIAIIQYYRVLVEVVNNKVEIPTDEVFWELVPDKKESHSIKTPKDISNLAKKVQLHNNKVMLVVSNMANGLHITFLQRLITTSNFNTIFENESGI